MPAKSETMRLSSKGQVVLPGSLRKAYQWDVGTEFVVEDTPDGILLRPVARVPATRIEDVAGSLESRRPRVRLAEMETAIVREAKKRHARGRC